MRIRGVAAYARHLHRGTWYVHGLPADLGARHVTCEPAPDLLGLAVHGIRTGIAINAAIVGTPLELPVIAHECAHLLLGHDIGYCSTSLSAQVRPERDAWDGAALLAIPTESAVMFATRRATVHDLADYYEVPPALVYMRGALAVLLGEVEGDRAHARQSLAAARRSLEGWMAAVARGI